MQRRIRRATLLGLVFLLAALAVFNRLNRSHVPERPDIVLITVDTLRADHLGAYGYEPARTPNIDALAAEGTVFLQATTPFPRTTPGLASLLTGLWPQGHGSREVAQPIKKDVTTLGEVLRKQGYVTVGASANGAAGRHQGMDRGFDRFLNYEDLLPPVAEIVMKRTLEAVAEAPQNQPLFLWVHTIDPHFPYQPPPEYAGPEVGASCRSLQAELATDTWRIAEVQRNKGGVSEAVLGDCIDLYDAEIAYTDAQVGRLLEELGEIRGNPDDTLVIFTADHGENLGEDGLYFEHGPSVHDAGLKVPLILRGPGIPERRDRRGARLEDVTPTLLSLLRVPRTDWPAMDGVDLSPRLRPVVLFPRPQAPDTYAESGSALLPNVFNRVHSGRAHELHCLNAPRFSLCGRPGQELGLYEPAADPYLEHDLSETHPREKAALLAARHLWPPEQARSRALRGQRFKLVEVPVWRGGYSSALYDLQRDPGETRDVKQLHPRKFQDLSRRLSVWTATLPQAAPGERSEEQLQALRALGYVQ